MTEEEFALHIVQRVPLSTVSRLNLNLGVLFFCRRRKIGEREEQLLERGENLKKFNPLMTTGPAFEPRPHALEQV